MQTKIIFSALLFLSIVLIVVCGCVALTSPSWGFGFAVFTAVAQMFAVCTMFYSIATLAR